MNTYKFTLILIVLFSFNVHAQKIDIRAFGGITIAQWSGDITSNFINGVSYEQTLHGSPGFQTGLSVTIGERFYLQPGIQWTSFSGTIKNTSALDGAQHKDKVNISAVSIPLRVGVRLLNGDSKNLVNLRAFGGLISHHVVDLNHKKKSGLFNDFDVDDFSNMILNADLGMGVDFLWFFADAGYWIGLSELQNGSNTRSNSFYLNGGLRLKF